MSEPLAEMLHADESVEFVDFGGVEIVNTFGETALEYAAICRGCGLMSLPQRGFIEVTGADRHSFLGNLLTNKIYDLTLKRGLDRGAVVPSLLLNLKGRIVSAMNVVELGDRLLIETDVRQLPMLTMLLDRYLFTEKVKIINRCDALHEFSLMGDRADELIKEFIQIDQLPNKLECTALATRYSQSTTIFRDDISASPCYFVVVERTQALTFWRQITERFCVEQAHQSARRRLRPVGWAAFNACRIEAGRAIAGIDYDLAEPSMPGRKNQQAPPETGVQSIGLLPAELNDVERVVDFNKGCYLGQEIVARMHARKQTARRIVGWRASDDVLPIAGAPVFGPGGEQVGIVTSSTLSPRLGNIAIGLALVKKPHFEIDSELQVPAEGSTRTVRISRTPIL